MDTVHSEKGAEMSDLIDRQAAIDAVAYALKRVFVEYKEIAEKVIGKLPSALGDAEFISWLLDEVWDEEMWELNYKAFPELLCRRLVRAGWLKEEDGKYVRHDK